jgi:hypothetical protein
VTIREIQPQEWDQVAHRITADGGNMPCPDQATVIVAVDERGLAGFWAVQQCWHVGPLWIREDQRGTGLWRKLHAAVDALFARTPGTGYYSFSGMPKVEAIFQKLGYRDLGYKVWAKETR